MTTTTKTVGDVLNTFWYARVGEEVGDEVLGWDADSVCGEAVIRIARLADYVAGEWPNTRDDVHAAAVSEMCVVCHG